MPSSEMISELEGWHRRRRMKLWQPRNISKTCEGLCCHDILVVEPPYIAEAKVRAKDCLRVGFLYLWCQAQAEAAGGFRGLVEWAFVVEPGG
jgi:hypothetical protein